MEVKSTDGAFVHLEDGVCVSRGVSLVAQVGRLHIGANTFVGSWSTIVARESIVIGRGCQIAERVTIRDQDHQIHGPVETPIVEAGFVCARVVIADGVWIGAGAVILKGVSIGRGAVVAANAVVNSDVAPGEIVGGIPARRIGLRTPHD